MKPLKLKPPKVKKLKKYHKPSDLEFLFVYDSWGIAHHQWDKRQDAAEYDRRVQETVNNVSEWFRRMLLDEHPGTEVKAVYHQGTHNHVIVEISKANVNPNAPDFEFIDLVGLHNDFLNPHNGSLHPPSHVSRIYEYDYIHKGAPQTHNWSCGLPQYRLEQVPASFPVKTPYPSPITAPHLYTRPRDSSNEFIIWSTSLTAQQQPTNNPNQADTSGFQPYNAPAHLHDAIPSSSSLKDDPYDEEERAKDALKVKLEPTDSVIIKRECSPPVKTEEVKPKIKLEPAPAELDRPLTAEEEAVLRTLQTHIDTRTSETALLQDDVTHPPSPSPPPLSAPVKQEQLEPSLMGFRQSSTPSDSTLSRTSTPSSVSTFRGSSSSASSRSSLPPTNLSTPTSSYSRSMSALTMTSSASSVPPFSATATPVSSRATSTTSSGTFYHRDRDPRRPRIKQEESSQIPQASLSVLKRFAPDLLDAQQKRVKVEHG